MKELVVIDRPNSNFSEEIKKTRTNLKFSQINEDTKAMMITSSVPGEGKSFVAANLAASFAQYNEKVLLIDCDLRKGRQKKIFNIPEESDGGLSNLLIDKEWETAYPSYIKKTKVSNLFVIPTGPFPPNPSELLATERFMRLIEELKKVFDIIILDCPPVVGLNDAVVVASVADISILVAKYKGTSKDLVERSKKSLDSVNARIAGVILNQMDGSNNSYYYGGYYKEQ